MITKEQLHPDDQANWPGFVSYICGKWEIARRYKPETILEIGVRAGYAAWAFLKANPDAKYIGIDNYSYGDYPEWAKENLLKNTNANIYKANSQKTNNVSVLLRFSVWPDFVHVDGDHTKEGVMHDLDLSFSVLREDGVILVDDYDRVPDVRQGVDEWLKKHPYLDWKYCESFTGDILIGNIVQGLPKQEQELIPKPENKGKLLVFHHGLGDLVLFLPLYERLKAEGNYGLALQEGAGFTPLVEGSIETLGGNLDYDSFCKQHGYNSYQIVKFDMSEGSGKTKTEYCAEKEFGLKVEGKQYSFIQKDYKVVGVCFQGTCLPGQTNSDEETAKKIWNEIKSAGCIPLEIMFEHAWHNPVNKKYDWIDNTTRGMKADVHMLLHILESCSFFIGVASGVWVMATTELEDRDVCLLSKRHKVEDYFRDSRIHSIDIDNYQDGGVKKWLKNMLS